MLALRVAFVLALVLVLGLALVLALEVAITRVAKELDLYGPQSISGVLKRKYISAHVEKRVSEIIGVPLTELFPDRY